MHDQPESPPPGWSAEGYDDASEGMCAVLASVELLDAAVSRLPVSDPASVIRLIDRVRHGLDFIESSAR